MVQTCTPDAYVFPNVSRDRRLWLAGAVTGRIDRAGYESEQVGRLNRTLSCSQVQIDGEVAKEILWGGGGMPCYGPNRCRLVLEWREKD